MSLINEQMVQQLTGLIKDGFLDLKSMGLVVVNDFITYLIIKEAFALLTGIIISGLIFGGIKKLQKLYDDSKVTLGVLAILNYTLLAVTLYRLISPLQTIVLLKLVPSIEIAQQIKTLLGK